MAAGRLSCLARNGRSPGEESLTDAIAAQAIEAKPSSSQISQGEAVGPRRTASSGEDVADPKGPAQDIRRAGRRERGCSVEKGRHQTRGQSSNDKAAAIGVCFGRAEIGAAWSKQSNEGRDYLSLKLDDPSFTAPIYANLFDDEGGEGYTLLWSRPRKNGE